MKQEKKAEVEEVYKEECTVYLGWEPKFDFKIYFWQFMNWLHTQRSLELAFVVGAMNL